MFRHSYRAVLPLILLAATASAQLTIDGNLVIEQGVDGITGNSENGDRFGDDVVTGDFDGDGIKDIAVGVPGEDGGRGVVQVIYGGVEGPVSDGNQVWGQGGNGLEGNAEDGDVFGFSIATGDLNGDGYSDLVVGVPGEDNSSGIIHVIYGSANGLALSGAQVWAQGRSGITGNAENGDTFGYDVTAGDFNGDGYDDVAVGAPGEASSGGIVNIIYGSASGLTSNGNGRIRQGADGVPGGQENGDSFGFSVFAGDFNGDGFMDLAIGVPGEDSAEGRIDVMYGSNGGLTSNGHQGWTQDNIFGNGNSEDDDQFGRVLTAGDFNGDGFHDLAVTALGENNARGDVTVLYGSPSGLAGGGAQQFRQGQNGVEGGEEESGDVFGSALAAGDFNLDGYDELAVGVRGEDSNRGLVQVFRGAPNRLSLENQHILAQGFEDLADQAENNDDFGYALATGDVGGDFADELIISAPGEDNDRGIVHVVFGVEDDANARPVITSVVGAGLSLPLVNAASYNSIITIFGRNIAPAGLARQVRSSDLVGGRVPQQLDTWCVEINDRRAPLFGIFGEPVNQPDQPDQINLQARLVAGESMLRVEVINNCGSAAERVSNSFTIPARAATPEFFLFDFSENGVDPVAAVDAVTYAPFGPAFLGNAFRRARPGDFVTVFFTGGGETIPRFEPGELPNTAASTVLNARLFLGGVEIVPQYVGVTGGNAGLYQVNFQVPVGTASGNLALRLVLQGAQGTFETPSGGYLSVGLQ